MLNSNFHSVCVKRNLSFVRVISPILDKLCYIQLNPFSSVPEANTPNPNANQDAYIVNYLIKTFGFSQENAFNASKHLKFDSVEKPESVIAFLKNIGMKTEEVGQAVRYFPRILLCDPQKTLLPKIEFFRSMGISQAEVNKIIQSETTIFKRSLEKQIVPAFSYIKTLFESSGTSLGFTKRLAAIFRCNIEAQLIPNVEILRAAGVPDSKIVILLQYQPRAFMVDTERFRKVVDEVKQINISPSRLNFILAIHAFRSMTKSTWDEKVSVYKKWGWSDDDIILAFEKCPYCMMQSADKIMMLMEFIVNEMGLDYFYVVKRPVVVTYSFEKRIKPRGKIYLILLENGLIKKDYCINTIFILTEVKFLKKFVERFEKETPGLLQAYEKELALSKS